MKLGMIWLRRGLLVIEWFLTLITGRIMRLIPRREQEPMIEVFTAVETPAGWFVKGRILAERKLVPPKPEDGRWINFKRMASQWFTKEIPRARISIIAESREIELISDSEGYFEHQGHDSVANLTIKLPEHAVAREISLTGNRLTTSPVVISDVDDTLMETGAVSLGKMLKTTLFGNSLTRELVKGMPELFRELRSDRDTVFYYVTSSPWNLAAFLKRVFDRVGLPEGGLFMTDWGLTPEQWVTPSHDVHKRVAIDRVARWHQDSEIILFGDDSQKDPEIYVKVLEAYEDRIKAIFIRSVAGAERKRQTTRLFEQYGANNCYVVDSPEEINAILNITKS